MDIKAGDTLKLQKSERPYRMAGLVDHSCMLPAEEHIVQVRRVTKTKKGRKVHVQPGPHGFAAILVDQLPDFATISKVAA